MWKCALAAATLILIASPAYADVVRPECQTEESRGLRLVSEALRRAAEESEPFHGCENGCQMPTAQADMMRATAERFRAEGRISLLRGRAMEAAKCPQWERAIMDNRPATAEEKAEVAGEFEDRMQQQRDRLASLKQWQKDHPQCKHVAWFVQFASSAADESYSKEDLTGNFTNQPGLCSASGHGAAWYGTEDDLKMSDPTTNPLIAQVACSSAMRKFGFGEGSYIDPQFCSR